MVATKIESIIDKQVLADTIDRKRVFKVYGFLYCAMLSVELGYLALACIYSGPSDTQLLQWWGQVIAAVITAVIVLCYIKSLLQLVRSVKKTSRSQIDLGL